MIKINSERYKSRDKMYIPPCPECMCTNCLIYDIINDDWICKNCGYIIYGGYFDDDE